MIFKRYFWVILALFFHAFFVSAKQEWSADDVPIPYLKDSTQYVSDPDGYLDKAVKDSANFYLRKLNVECGVQNVFVIVGHSVNQDAFRMAQDIGNKYGIGYKASRRGLVVVIAVEDHKYFIAPGMGLEGELTDVDCDDIARACIVGNMRENHPGMAVLQTSKAIYNKVKSGRTGIEEVDDGPVSDDDWGFVVFFLLLCFGVPLFFLIRYVLEEMGIVKRKPSSKRQSASHRCRDDDWFPPFFLGGGGGFSSGSSFSGFSGGSFGGGTFGGGGSGGGW